MEDNRTLEDLGYSELVRKITKHTVDKTRLYKHLSKVLQQHKDFWGGYIEAGFKPAKKESAGIVLQEFITEMRKIGERPDDLLPFLLDRKSKIGQSVERVKRIFEELNKNYTLWFEGLNVAESLNEIAKLFDPSGEMEKGVAERNRLLIRGKIEDVIQARLFDKTVTHLTKNTMMLVGTMQQIILLMRDVKGETTEKNVFAGTLPHLLELFDDSNYENRNKLEWVNSVIISIESLARKEAILEQQLELVLKMLWFDLLYQRQFHQLALQTVDMNVRKFAFTREYIEWYREILSLPQETVEHLYNKHLTFDRIRWIAQMNVRIADERVFGLDCYQEDDPNVEIESPETRWHLLSPKGLGGDGFIMMLDGKDVAYALIHPIAGLFNEDCPQEYREMSERVDDWRGIISYLNNVLKPKKSLTVRDVYHHYDYAVTVSKRDSIGKDKAWKDERRRELRRRGYGRLVLRFALDVALPMGSIAVGFIDPGSLHVDSLVSVMKGGLFIGKEIDTAFDGEHPAFLEIYGKNLNPRFTGIVINYRHKQDDIRILPNAIRAALSAHPECMVAYNKERNVFELIEFSSQKRV